MDRGESLHELARAAAARAHAPYSGFRVGAVVRLAGGGSHVGCNVENAAFPLSGCAERHALAAAVAATAGRPEIESVTVVALGPDGVEVPAPPCGACRQQIVEFGPAIRVGFMATDGRRVELPVAELLPHPFLPAALR